MQSSIEANNKQKSNIPLVMNLLAAAVTVWTVILCLWLYLYSVRHGGIPCWDGYERCAWASHIWYDIRHIDPFHLWRHTNHQVVWPFLHSWITGLLFALLGPSLATARLVSLAAFAGSALLILAWFGRRRDPFAWVGGITAWLLFTSSPMSIQHSVGIMSEMPGLFLVLLALTVLPDERDESPRRAGWCGVLLALLFFYKYNFAFLTYIGLVLHRLSVSRFSFRRMLNRQNTLIFGIPILFVGLWFIPDFGRKFDNLIYFATNNPAARMPFGWDSLMFYPKVIPPDYYAFAPGFGLSVLFVIAAMVINGRRSLNSPILTCFLIHFLASVVHPMKMSRFQFISMGLFFILTGEAIQTYLSVLARRVPKTALATAVGLSAIVLVVCMTIQPQVYRSPQLAQENVYVTPIRTIADQIQETDHIAILSTHELVNPPAMTFYFMTSLDCLQKNLHTNESRWDHIFLFKSIGDVTGLTLEERIKHLRYELFIHNSNAIVTVENISPGWKPETDPVFGGSNEYIKVIASLPEYALAFEQLFPQSKTRVRIYRRVEQAAV